MIGSILLGVDGGGTSTTAWLADSQGRVIGRGQAGPSNLKAIGADAARAGLDRSIQGAFENAGLAVQHVAVSCLGLAGCDRPEDRRWLEEWAVTTSWAGRLILVNDGDLVVAAGTPEGWGVGVIAGTGSIAVGRSIDGQSARAGGWGHLIGDEGSAYSVALAGLRRVVRRADGRSGDPLEADPLAIRLCEALKIGGTGELVSALYHKEVDRTRIAALAPAVVAASLEDSSLIRQILEPAGIELAEMVGSVARQLGLRSGPLPVAMAGSFLLNCPAVSQIMIRWLMDRGYDVQAQAVRDPVQGALILALGTLHA